MVKTIAVDNGKGVVKATDGNSVKTFLNLMCEGNHINNIGREFLVDFNGKTYTLGDSGEDCDYNESKRSEHHFISTLTAITQFIEPKQLIEVYLVVGESFNMFRNNEHKEGIKRDFINEGNEWRIVVNGNLYRFIISQVLVGLEGMAFVFKDPLEYKGMRYILDVGTVTSQFIVLNNLNPRSDLCSSFTFGMNNLVTSISKELSQTLKRNDNEDQIREYIIYGCGDKAISDVVNSTIRKQLKKIVSNIGKTGSKLEQLNKVYIVGGVGKELYRHIQEVVPNAALVANPSTANVEGYYHIAIRKWGMTNV